jgi:hypothetical protein
MAETQNRTPGPNDSDDLSMNQVAVAAPGGASYVEAPRVEAPRTHPHNDTPLDPEGQVAEEAQQAEGEAAGLAPEEVPAPGVGLDGEFTIWEGRYSLRNFAGRMFSRLVMTVAWCVLAYYTWGRGQVSRPLEILAWITAGLLVLYWLGLLWQAVRARLSHFYRLTNKRLFVWTGVFRRRLDQLELVKVNDVYTSEPGLWHRWFKVGSVVIESSEERYPVTYLTGVDEPTKVMDTVWHTSRAEREGHTVRVDQV